MTENTIADVARRAGVSAATVSRALRGLGSVRPETRARVLAAAAELDYVASPDAAGLASGRSRIVGIVTPFVARWYFSAILSAAEKTMRAAGYHVLLTDLERNDDARLTITDASLFRRVDGLLVVNVALEGRELRLVQSLGLPVVQVGYREGDWPAVGIDEHRCTRLVTEHLIDLGHTSIGYVGDVIDANVHRRTPKARLAGFRDTMHAAGLEVRAEQVLRSTWTLPGGFAAYERLAERPGATPTALVCGSDEIATGVLAAARRRGLDVPGDLAVTGIDDHDLARIWDLTTVRQDVAEIGSTAATMLLAALDGTPAEGTRTSPVTLVPRGSTLGVGAGG